MVEVEKEGRRRSGGFGGLPRASSRGLGILPPPPPTGKRGGAIPGRPWVGRDRRERAP